LHIAINFCYYQSFFLYRRRLITLNFSKLKSKQTRISEGTGQCSLD
jgi:hypothetical protein